MTHNAENERLEGIALSIWKEVVYRGETLVLHRNARPVAVVVPFDEYEEMRRLIDGSAGTVDPTGSHSEQESG